MANPRLPGVPFSAWDEEARAVLLPSLRRPELYLSGWPDARPMPKVMELFASHLALAAAWLPFSDMLSGPESLLEPRVRELLILRVAWRTGSEYEWVQHTRLGLQVGLDRERLQAVADGPGSDAWTGEERALLTAVDEMIDGFGVAQPTWQALSGHFSPAQMLEILFVIGSYACLAAVFNSAGLQPDAAAERVDAPALPARARRHGV